MRSGSRETYKSNDCKSFKSMENMIAQSSLLEVPTEQLTVSETVSLFSYPSSGQKLLDSVSSKGILNPIAVGPGLRESYIIICGVKRYRAACELGLGSVPVRVISGRPLTGHEVFDIAFHDNSTVRSFNTIELAGVVTMLDSLYKKNEIMKIDTYFSILGTDGGAGNVELLKEIFNFDDSIKSFIEQWSISVQHASRLALLQGKDRDDLFEVIKTLQIHGGKFKQCVELVHDICRRDTVPVSGILHQTELQKIVNDTKTTQSQKQAKLLNFLHGLRYPKLVEYMNTFSKLASSLKNINSGVFSPPQNFEGDSIRASIAFKSLSDLDLFCEGIQDESNRGKILLLLKLL
jgi:hypothetical protein